MDKAFGRGLNMIETKDVKEMEEKEVIVKKWEKTGNKLSLLRVFFEADVESGQYDEFRKRLNEVFSHCYRSKLHECETFYEDEMIPLDERV